MAKFILGLTSLKNAVSNCILVRIFWAIVGAVGVFTLMIWADDQRIERGEKPMYLRKAWHTRK